MKSKLIRTAANLESVLDLNKLKSKNLTKDKVVDLKMFTIR